MHTVVQNEFGWSSTLNADLNIRLDLERNNLVALLVGKIRQD